MASEQNRFFQCVDRNFLTQVTEEPTRRCVAVLMQYQKKCGHVKAFAAVITRRRSSGSCEEGAQQKVGPKLAEQT